MGDLKRKFHWNKCFLKDSFQTWKNCLLIIATNSSKIYIFHPNFMYAFTDMLLKSGHWFLDIRSITENVKDGDA